MARTAEQTARAAEATFRNKVGMCLQQSRQWADIGSRYPDATTAWNHTNDRHPGDRRVPRGAMAYWTGGSRGFGHIAPGVGGVGSPCRSTDAGGSGIVATRTLAWFDVNWPSLRYAGWAWDVNEVTIPHDEKDWFDMATEADLRKIIKEELAANNKAVSAAVWKRVMRVTKPNDEKIGKTSGTILRETWSKLSKHMDQA